MQLILFPSPLDAHWEFQHDQGWTAIGVPYTHPDGRKGQSITIPDGTPNSWGARRIVSAPKKVTVDERGILMLTPERVWFEADDVVLQDVTSASLPRLVVNGQFLAQDVP